MKKLKKELALLHSAYRLGKRAEFKRIVSRMEDYYGLIEYADEEEGAEPNEEWCNGYQAALWLIKGESQNFLHEKLSDIDTNLINLDNKNTKMSQK